MCGSFLPLKPIDAYACYPTENFDFLRLLDPQVRRELEDAWVITSKEAEPDIPVQQMEPLADM